MNGFRPILPHDAHLLIIGAMKCGTSSLFEYLSGHPQVCPATIKEPEFFSENQAHRASVGAYEALWPAFDRRVHRYALEASTGYTKHPMERDVAKRIFEYGLRPKFIYIMRDPFDRIASHSGYIQRDGSRRLSLDDRQLIDTTNYFLQLEQYRRFFPREDFLLLHFEELKTAPRRLMERVYDFLGLSHTHFPERYIVKNSTASALAESRLDRAIRLPWASRLRPYVPRPARAAARALATRALEHAASRVPAPAKPALTAEQRRMVLDALGADMLELRRVYGFDVGKWGFPQRP